nr:hypothetical protein [uncultured Dyadobacter sp.]
MKFDQLMVEIYGSNFENADEKILAFEKVVPSREIEADFNLRQMFDYLKVQVLEYQGDAQKALDLAIKVWKRYSPVHHSYITTGLHIVQLMSLLGMLDEASKFVEEAILNISADELKSISPIAVLKMLPAYKPSNDRDVDKATAIISHIEAKLELIVDFDRVRFAQSLAEVANLVSQEGKQLTELLATSGSRSQKENSEVFEHFLATSRVGIYRNEAKNFLESSVS